MLTARYIRDNLDAIRKSLEKRHSDYPLNELLSLDEQSRKVNKELQELRAEHNKGSEQISEMKKAGKQHDEQLVKKLADVKKRIDNLENSIPKQEERLQELLWSMPNILDESVPVGGPPEANKVIKTWGKPMPRKIPTHEEILGKLNMLDIERARKTTGARFYFMKGDLVLLELSLMRYVLDLLTKRGYTPVLPPFMLKKKYYKGAAPLATFEDALYRVGEPEEASKLKEVEHVEDELFLIGTAEHALATMHAEEVFSISDLPIKYAGISPCFRREAGAHGKDTKGMFRVHQFDKIEQFIYCKKEDEQKYFDELLGNTEKIWQELNIPYQLVLLCSEDTGHQMTKTVDIECYMPGQKAYRELGSCSSAGVWQSMRLDMKYDEKQERKYVYTLNNTAVPAQRALVCIVENYVNNDGTITVPDVLVPYMGKSKIGSK
ncbi:MAG: serine--tRNA ligase [Candidatus Micrarchaeales archaeon]